MNNLDDMKYVERFEDDRFVYELKVEAANRNNHHLYTFSQGDGFQCRWDIAGKELGFHNIVAVTDDQCEVIIFDSIESAIRGAKDFLSL